MELTSRSSTVAMCRSAMEAGKNEHETGNELVRQGRYDMAIERYMKALELLLPSNSPSPSLAASTTSYDGGVPSGSVQDLQLKLYLNLAHCHLKLRNYEIARDYCNECLALDPKNVKGFLRRALANEGVGNFQQSLHDLTLALQHNSNPVVIAEILQIQTRVRGAASLDQRALKEETVPVSYVTSNQSLRLNFGGVYPAEIRSKEPFRIRLNITNEFGLWNRLHLSSSSDLDDHVTKFSVDVSLIPMSKNIDDLLLEIHSQNCFGSNGRVELTLSIYRQSQCTATDSLSIPFLLKFSCSESLPSGLPVHSILTLPILLHDSSECLTPSSLSPLIDMSTHLNANGIRIQSVECGHICHGVYVLESPGSLGIGGKVWDATYVILDYLQTVPDCLKGRHIIELGSGTGLVGLSLRFFQPSSVLLTDMPAVVPLLKANILLNQILCDASSYTATHTPSPIYEAVTHTWGTPLDPLMMTPSPLPSLIIASDVVYDPAGFQPLLTTLQALLLPPSPQDQAIADLVIMAHRHRNPEDHQFFSMVSSQDSDLSIQEINLDHIFATYREGDNSLRDVKIFHISQRKE